MHTATKPMPAPAPAQTAPKKETILSGMQPTGALHIGNLEGALRNWVRLQDSYWMYCCIVDLHDCTTAIEKLNKLCRLKSPFLGETQPKVGSPIAIVDVHPSLSPAVIVVINAY